MYNRGFLHAPWQGMIGPYNRQLLVWSVERVIATPHLFLFLSASLFRPLDASHTLEPVWSLIQTDPNVFRGLSKSRVPRIYSDNFFFSLYKVRVIQIQVSITRKAKTYASPQRDRTSLLTIPYIFLQKENSIIICLFSLTTPCYNVE